MYAPKRFSRQTGFTLVELMIGMVLSLLVGLAALGSAQFFMSMQRQSGGIGASVANTSTAFAAIKYEAAQAGLGFYNNGGFPCATFNVASNGVTTADNGALLPVRITTAGTESTLSLYYADAIESAGATTLVANTAANAASAQISTYLPVAVGQAVLLMADRNEGVPCSLRTVTAITASTGAGQTLAFGSGGALNGVSFTQTPTYAAGHSVSLFGALRSATFALEQETGKDTKQLIMTRPFEGGGKAVMAKNVVAMVMQYGVSDASSGVAVASWRYPKNYPSLATPKDWTTPTVADLSTVRAIRVSLIVRSAQMDKKVDGSCITTLAMPTLVGVELGQAPALVTDPLPPGAVGLDSATKVSTALTGDWQCYRYAETSVVVPLRNMILGGVQ